jgi:hypothetical protein
LDVVLVRVVNTLVLWPLATSPENVIKVTTLQPLVVLRVDIVNLNVLLLLALTLANTAKVTVHGRRVALWPLVHTPANAANNITQLLLVPVLVPKVNSLVL